MIVAVIDIGSNSIKLLVAARPGGPEQLAIRSIDARIGAGMSQIPCRLTSDGMDRAVSAIRALLAESATHRPDRIVLVATSAVRDAENGPEFCQRVRTETGHSIRVLSGDEEAQLIGRGLLCDPVLRDCEDLHVFDLGGGSLECLLIRGRRVERAMSLPLGCVRTTERFVPDVHAPFSVASREAIITHVRAVLAEHPMELGAPGLRAVFAGGTMTTVRAILAARHGVAIGDVPAEIGVAEIRALLDTIAVLPLHERRQIPGLPAARADIFPAALATLLAVAGAGLLPAFTHSFYNLRWGVADEILAGQPAPGTPSEGATD